MIPILLPQHGGNGEGFPLEDVGGFDYPNMIPVSRTQTPVLTNEGVDYTKEIIKSSTGGTGFAADT